MKSIRVVTGVLMAVTLFTGSLFAEPSVQAEASKLLKEVQLTAGQLNAEAARLDSYPRGGISRQGHAVQLNLVKSQINALGVRLAMLQEMRGQAHPWQQDAIDSVVPIAQKVAAHTQAAIVHLNESGVPLWHPDYTGHLRAISDRSGQIKDTIDLHLAISATADKLDRLREKNQ